MCVLGLGLGFRCRGRVEVGVRVRVRVRVGVRFRVGVRVHEAANGYRLGGYVEGTAKDEAGRCVLRIL